MTQWTARLSLAAVALIAGIASYLHALVVVQAADGHGLVAWFIPLLADLVIASAATNILHAAKTGHDRPLWSVMAVGVGVVATLYLNWKSGNPSSVPSWLVNVWPPIAFGLALESIVGMVRRDGGTVKKDDVLYDADPDEPPDLNRDLLWLAGRHSQRSIAALFGVNHGLVGRRVATARDVLAGVSLNGSAPDAEA